jgi:surfactin synthase thioesterase subunit
MLPFVAGLSALWLQSLGAGVPVTHVGTPPGALVCLPYAGGSASFFYGLARASTAGAQMLGARYPGRQARLREPLAASIDELASGLCPALLGAGLSRVVLFGHSMGALLGFEIAARLQGDSSIELAGLLVSAARAPSVGYPELAVNDEDAPLLAMFERLGGDTAELLADPEFRALMLPALKADNLALSRYLVKDPVALDMPVSVIWPVDDPEVTWEHVEPWRLTSRHEVDVREVTGGHFYLYDWPPDVIALVDACVAPWLSSR